MNKVLRSLLDFWNIKVTTIEESKDLSKMGMDELIESILTYEMKRKLKEDETKAKKGITLKMINEEGEEDSSIDEQM